jgi:outer membrane lipopolysaccharide assembly protein LptE/RlpB
MKGPRPLLNFALCLLTFALTSCGYHVAGATDVLPKNVKTIAIPAFGNITTRYKISDLLAAAITREFISRTRYQIVSDPGQADAVLTGSVVNFVSYPTIFDSKTGRAAGIQAIVMMQLSLRDHATNAVLFDRPHMEFRQNYEISVDPQAYFDESEVGMDRLSRDVARSVVSAVLENF